MLYVNPIADLSGGISDTCVQAGGTYQFRICFIKYTKEIIFVCAEPVLKNFYQVEGRGGIFRVMPCPGHPWPEVVEAFADGLSNHGGIFQVVTADNQSVRFYSVSLCIFGSQVFYICK